MFLLSRPVESQIRTILAGQRARNFSYPNVGATRSVMPTGYAVLRGRIDLGHGSATFDRAVVALRGWKMFDVHCVQLFWPHVRIESGEVVTVVVKHFGFWSVNCCRIVYVVDEDGPIRRYGFAYGTLPEHAEQGEERFTVEWDRASGLVCYNILSFSRPRSAVVKAAFPVARWMQRRFLGHSLAAMLDAVAR